MVVARHVQPSRVVSWNNPFPKYTETVDSSAVDRGSTSGLHDQGGFIDARDDPAWSPSSYESHRSV